MPIAYVRSWDEEEHPRGPGGKFVSAGSLRLRRGSKFKVGRRRKVNGRTHVTLTLVSQP